MKIISCYKNLVRVREKSKCKNKFVFKFFLFVVLGGELVENKMIFY